MSVNCCRVWANSVSTSCRRDFSDAVSSMPMGAGVGTTPGSMAGGTAAGGVLSTLSSTLGCSSVIFARQSSMRLVTSTLSHSGLLEVDLVQLRVAILEALQRTAKITIALQPFGVVQLEINLKIVGLQGGPRRLGEGECQDQGTGRNYMPTHAPNFAF